MAEELEWSLSKLIRVEGGHSEITRGGSMLFAVLAVATQLDRNYIREKTLEGQVAAAAKGNHGGRPKVIDDMLTFAIAASVSGWSCGAGTVSVATNYEIPNLCARRETAPVDRAEMPSGPNEGKIMARRKVQWNEIVRYAIAAANAAAAVLNALRQFR